MAPSHAKPPPDPNTLIFGYSTSQLAKLKDFLNPPNDINSIAGALLSKTAFVRMIFSILFI
jgi:hypothetical protein